MSEDTNEITPERKNVPLNFNAQMKTFRTVMKAFKTVMDAFEDTVLPHGSIDDESGKGER